MAVTEEEKSFSSLASRVQGKKKTDNAVKTTPFLPSLFLFFHEQCMKQRHFGQNTPFHLKGKDGKNVSSSHWSSICDLFNKVLNCNFDLKINAIASLPKIKQRL
jgi:hypothetical protein